jgi:enoyl-CoA hydratase/carnithine racemase
MSEPELLYETADGVAWLTINRESRRNAISVPVIDLFFEHLAQAEQDTAVRVICITATGKKAFCSGADLATSFSGEEYESGARRYADLLKTMAAFPKPLVAKVNGNCLAGGLGLMLSCDMVYARAGVKFGTPEVNVGLFPMMIGALIFRNVARKKALEMMYTARFVSSDEAEEIGLITRSIPEEEFDSTVNETLSTIASKAPLALSLGRQALALAEDRSLGSALEHLCDQLREVVETEDAKEGLTAFLQKRPPEWKGR